MTKTGKTAVGNTVNKTRRGAGADARARWEGKGHPAGIGSFRGQALYDPFTCSPGI